MWPSKAGLGSRIGYGIDGPSLHLEQLGTERPWIFSRARSSGTEFKESKGSYQQYVPPQISHKLKQKKKGSILDILDIESDRLKTVDDTSNIVQQEIPSQLLEDLNRVDAVLGSDVVYDPVIGKLMDFGKISKGTTGILDVMAYVTSEAKSKVTLRMIDYADVEITNHFEPSKNKKDGLLSGNALDEDNDVNGSNENDHKIGDKFYDYGQGATYIKKTSIVKVPTLADGITMEFNSDIRQIEISKASIEYPATSDLLMVRTSSTIFITRVYTINRVLKMDRVARIFSSDLEGFEWAHVVRSPFEYHTFAAIDVRGNWTVIRLTNKSRMPFMKYRGSIEDALDFSRFKMIGWCDNENELYVMSRNKVKRVNLKQATCTDILTLGRWSHLRDFSRSGLTDRYSFFLTSREILWIDTSRNFKRLLSWKHNFDNEDPSLKMSLSCVNEIQYVILFSQIHPVILLFQFKMDGEFPKSIHDPILLKSKIPVDGKDFNLYQFQKRSLSLFKLTKELELSRVLLTPYESAVFEYSEPTIAPQEEEPSNENALVLRKFYNTKFEPRRQAIRSIAAEIFHIPMYELKFTDPERFQEYASKFMDINKRKFTRPIVLRNYTKPIDEFDGFFEFDNMLEQLFEYYNSNGVSWLSLDKLSKTLTFYGKVSTLYELHRKLAELWSSITIAKEATRDVALSLSIGYDESVENNKVEEIIDDLPPKLKTLLDGWDSDLIDEPEETKQEIDEAVLSQVKTQPMIKTTQSQPSTQVVRNTRSRSSKISSQFSQSSQNSQSSQQRPTQFSQSQSSLYRPSQSISRDPFMSSQPRATQSSQSGHAKKRKRVRGFG